MLMSIGFRFLSGGQTTKMIPSKFLRFMLEVCRWQPLFRPGCRWRRDKPASTRSAFTCRCPKTLRHVMRGIYCRFHRESLKAGAVVAGTVMTPEIEKIGHPLSNRTGVLNKQYVALWEAYLLGRDGKREIGRISRFRADSRRRPLWRQLGRIAASAGIPEQPSASGWKDRAETVNNIPHKQKRNPVGVLFRCPPVPAGQERPVMLSTEPQQSTSSSRIPIR